MRLPDQSSDNGTSLISPEIQAEKPVREKILRRFEKWLDEVLAEEKPLTGIARDFLGELEDTIGSGKVEPIDNKDDLYSTWSAMTALTQEVKLQGRAFKQLSNRLESLLGLEAPIDRLLEAYKEAISDAGRFSEEAKQVCIERENKFKQAAYKHARHGIIEILIDIRDRFMIGLWSAEESRRKLGEYRHSSWLKRMLLNKGAGIGHLLEIIGSLKKGYLLSLDRLDEAMQRLEIHEIVCEGEPFDPQVMAVVDIEETEELSDGTVIEVYRTGYMIGEEVFRPAQVKVARALMNTEVRNKPEVRR